MLLVEMIWELNSRDEESTRQTLRAEAFEEGETVYARILRWDKSFEKASEAGA